MITEAIENELFITQNKLPLCTIDFVHQIIPQKDSIEVVHRIEMKGVLTFLFSKIMGNAMAKGLPDSVRKLIQLAENE